MFLPSTITLQPGDSGDFVAELQRRLTAVDCFSADAISGFYDGITTNAVSTFQSRTGLRVDGIAGPETLRRLNGVISGDTSATSDNKKEEEAQKEAASHSFLMQTAVMDQQAAMLSPAATNEFISEATQADPILSNQQQPQNLGPTAEQIAQQQQQQQLQQQMLVRDQAAQQMPPQQSASDILAQMMREQSANAQAAQHQPAPEKMAAQQQPSHQHQSPATPQQAPEQPRSMMGRAIQFASEFMQKLANYFEAKLPTSVLNEVKSIGQSMAQHGVKETPIPSEPTMRTAELPSRGQEQTQTPRRN